MQGEGGVDVFTAVEPAKAAALVRPGDGQQSFGEGVAKALVCRPDGVPGEVGQRLAPLRRAVPIVGPVWSGERVLVDRGRQVTVDDIDRSLDADASGCGCVVDLVQLDGRVWAACAAATDRGAGQG